MLIDPHLPNQRLMTMVLKLCHIESVDRVFFSCNIFSCIPIYARCSSLCLHFMVMVIPLLLLKSRPINHVFAQPILPAWRIHRALVIRGNGFSLCNLSTMCNTTIIMQLFSWIYSLGYSRYNQLLEQSSRLTMECIIPMRSFTWQV